MSDEKRTAPDWERIEADYRAGKLSLREVAARGGVSDGAIRKRAKKFGWPRDLDARIQAQADAVVRRQAVRAESTQLRTAHPDTERAIVDANAQAIADVRLAHRGDIRRGRALCVTLIGELETVTGEQLSVDLLRELVEADADDPKTIERVRAALDRAISLPSRAGTLKQLADALKSLVALEREAWGLDTDKQGGATYDDFLAELYGEQRPSYPRTAGG